MNPKSISNMSEILFIMDSLVSWIGIFCDLSFFGFILIDRTTTRKFEER
jgi:hypothetical protein